MRIFALMYDFHTDKPLYFRWQKQVTEEHVIPFIEQELKVTAGMRVLEIGCAEAGVLKAFLDKGCVGTGIELNPRRAAMAQEFLAPEISEGRVEIIDKNIYDIDAAVDTNFRYDLIILKDVIEHIFDQERFMKHLQSFLNPGGHVFFGFPPWQMPFGGHQQICTSKLLGVLPYYHLLPRPLYKTIISLAKERPATIQELLEIKETGLSIERFEKIVKVSGFSISQHQPFLINPIYKLKFGLKPRNQFKIFSALPYLRNFVTTAVYYLVKKSND